MPTHSQCPQPSYLILIGHWLLLAPGFICVTDSQHACSVTNVNIPSFRNCEVEKEVDLVIIKNNSRGVYYTESRMLLMTELRGAR